MLTSSAAAGNPTFNLDQLQDTSVFSADLDMRVFEVEQLKRQLGDVMSDVGTLERSLSDPPRITLVQPAIIVDVEDSPDEGAPDEEKSDDDESVEDLVSI